MGEAGSDSVQVAFEVLGESLKAGQIGGSRGRDPFRQPFASQLRGHVREGTDMAGKAFEAGAVGQYCLELKSVALGQSVGVGEDSAADRTGGWRPGADRL